MTAEEYLTADWEADREYVDGEILERHTRERPHSSAHSAVAFLLFQQAAQPGIRVLMSQRVQVSPARFRVPDVCVVLASDPRDPIVKRAPLLCVEVLCGIDTVTRIDEKLSDYFQMGVRYVWVLDPMTKRAFCHTPGEMHEVLDGMLRTSGPDLAVPLAEVFED